MAKIDISDKNSKIIEACYYGIGKANLPDGREKFALIVQPIGDRRIVLDFASREDLLELRRQIDKALEG